MANNSENALTASAGGDNGIPAVIDLMKSLGHPVPLPVKHPDGTEASLLFVPHGMRQIDLESIVDGLRIRPRRRKGAHTVFDLDSFIALANRFKDSASAIFADPTASSPSLRAILNFHEGNADAADGIDSDGLTIDVGGLDKKARHGDHTLSYAFPLSKEFQAWKGHDGKAMDMADFAEFLEDRIVDIAVPNPALLDILGPRQAGGDFGDRTPDEELAYLAMITGGTYATPQRLIELSRGMSIRENGVVKEVRKLASGEAQIQFETEHKDADGQPLAIPSLFLIEIPIFYHDVLWRLAARLRYRVTPGGIKWFYQLHRLDFAFEYAIQEACKKVADNTGLPLYRGKA